MDNMPLIAVFIVAFVAWLVGSWLTDRAYKKKFAAFEEDKRRIRANIAVSKLAHKKKGED